MFRNAAADTNIIFYLMIAVGVIGVLSKIVNQLTLHRMVKAAGNMSKSTHSLIKHVRDEYEHACTVHGTVDNVLAFIRKYLYEYRGFIFRIHTWRQLQIQAIWFSGILAVMGAAGHYMAHGFCEAVYQYIAMGLVQMAALFLVSQLTDEAYMIKGTEIYMADYLENVCANRYKKIRQTKKAKADSISNESVRISKEAASQEKQKAAISIAEGLLKKEGDTDAGQAIGHTAAEKSEENGFSTQKEEAIRLILAEFLA